MSPSSLRLTDAIILAVCYADVFTYAYKEDELILWVPFGNQWKKEQIKKSLRYLLKKKILKKKDEYIYISSQKTVYMRKLRSINAPFKWKKAFQAAMILKYIPTIYMVAVSGGLAMNNADKKDDIDFFIITKKGTVWITRLLATIALELYRLRRRPETIKTADTICLNMFVDEKYLNIPREMQDYFSAHEVLQCVPLWEKNHTYIHFLQENIFAKKIFPYRYNYRMTSHEQPIVSKSIVFDLCSVFLLFFEKPVKVLQLWYMRKRRSSEVVTDNVIRFHPKDARKWVFRKFTKTIQAYIQTPLDNIFVSP